MGKTDQRVVKVGKPASSESEKIKENLNIQSFERHPRPSVDITKKVQKDSLFLIKEQIK